jgi:hypothetical protein
MQFAAKETYSTIHLSNLGTAYWYTTEETMCRKTASQNIYQEVKTCFSLKGLTSKHKVQLKFMHT